MNKKTANQLVFLGFAGQLLIAGLNILLSLLHIGGFLTSLLNVVSLLCGIAIAVGFLFSYLNRRDLVSLLMFASFAVGLVLNRLVDVNMGGTAVSLILNCITGAYLLLWAYKLKDKNSLAALLLGCIFLWEIFGDMLLFRLIAPSDFTITLWSLINVGTIGVRAFAAYSDL